MDDRKRRIIIRWRTRGQVQALGPTLERLYPVDESPCLEDAIDAIDQAERHVWSDGDPKADN